LPPGRLTVELQIGHTIDGDYDILAPEGELDIASFTQLRSRIAELIDAGRPHIVIDLSGTAFLDSTALGALIGGRRKAYAAGGSFAVICDNPQLLKLFTITKLDLVFTVLPSHAAWREAVGI
jgi:anti-sigma B factor antagonist